MSDIETLYVVLLVVCFVLSAFFASSEIAFFFLQRVKLEHMASTGVRGAALVSRMLDRPDRLLSIILLGNNLVNTGAAALATALAVSIWRSHGWQEQGGILVATIAVTIILLIFGETIPKTIAIRHTERLSILFARPIEWLLWILIPFVVVLSWIASGLSKMLGGTPVPRSLASEEEIRNMITVGHREGTVEESEAKMLHKVFDFGDRRVREVMVPRPEVVAIEQGSKVAEFLALYAQFPRSRFPVFNENMDNVVGILAIKDILMAQAKEAINQQSPIDELLRPAYFTPETKLISELFNEMRDSNFRMAVVVDEFGGTAGIVMLSRLVEEIVGEVGDELAAVEKDYEAIDAYTFEIDGGMRIEEANEEMGLGLPEGEYETVAGFVLNLLRRIPRPNEQIVYKDMKLVVSDMRGVKIEKIVLTRGRHATTSD
ncbi:MAG: HlyC/CorC family transporter [Dehalococcoidales bacterium]|nr:HlyC/CorC family transporter [Dehalococcoidales bacterium]